MNYHNLCKTINVTSISIGESAVFDRKDNKLKTIDPKPSYIINTKTNG